MAQRFICTLLICTLALTLFAGCDSQQKTIPQIHTVSEETASWNMDVPEIYVTPGQSTFVSYSPLPWALQFHTGIVVEARIIEVFSDIYALPGKSLARRNYRVLRLEVLDVIAGEHVPDELYYLLDSSYEAKLTRFDSLIISMRQLGVGSYLMLNTTSCKYERFGPLFASGTYPLLEESMGLYYDPTYITMYNTLSILPFTDGVLDTFIFALPGWESSANQLRIYEDFFPVHPGYTLQQAKDAIVAAQEAHQEGAVYTVYTVDTPEIYPDKELYNSLCSFENGIFAQTTKINKKTVFCRMVNGFYTNEYYSFTPGENVVRSSVTFSPEECAQLPDLEPFIQTMIDDQPEQSLKSRFDKFDAYYYKTSNGKIIGVLRMGDRKYNNYIVTMDGHIKKVSTNVLDAYLQGDWEAARYREVWESLVGNAYSAKIIYENRNGEYVYGFGRNKLYIHSETVSLPNVTSELRATPINPSAIDLDNLLPPEKEFWPELHLNYETITTSALYAWRLGEGGSQRDLRYLVMLNDGTMLLVIGYDYTGVYEDDRGTKTIHYIHLLTEA